MNALYKIRNQKQLPGHWNRLQTRGKAIFGSLFLLMMFPIADIWAQTTYSFDAAGTQEWQIPSGATRIQIEAWGGGANGTSARGGNGADYVRSYIINYADEPAANILTVNVGGAGQQSGVFFNGQPDRYYVALGGKNDGSNQNLGFGFTDRFYFFGGNGGINKVMSGVCFVSTGGGGGGSAFTSENADNGQNGNCNFGKGGNGQGTGGDGGKYTAPLLGTSMAAKDGYSPGGGGGGNVSGILGKGAIGRVRITVYCDMPNPGTIGTSHTIVTPQERIPDFITNVDDASGAWGPLGYIWQSSLDGSTNWATIPEETDNSFNIPPLTQPTFYRRGVTGCAQTIFSNTVKINVLAPNGNISGFVRSTGGVGVQGITIKITKKTDLPGSPKEFEYSALTESDGSYNIPVYYGDVEEAGGSSISTGFWISASREGHVFTNDSLERNISNTLFNVNPVDFVDETAYSITGRIFQKCVGCLNNSNVPTTITSNLDGINIYNKGKFAMTTRYLESALTYGSWAATVLNQGSYSFRPQLAGRKFVPDSSIVPVLGNVANINFEDTTTHLITGKIGDGCKVKTGDAILEFKDVLVDNNGRLRAYEFRKRVTTLNGQYAIRLPARKYQVTVVSYTNDVNAQAPIQPAEFLAFFNTNSDSGVVISALRYDSLLADISDKDKVLNLYYQRAPELELVNLDNQTCNSSILSFVTFPQSVPKPYQVKVWQGSKNLGCRLNDDSVIVNTNVQNDDENERRAFKVRNGFVRDTLIGGVPKILGDFAKIFTVSYKDRYDRAATSLDKRAVVTGVKADNTSSFATTSPQVPIMILHDPAGDQSSSYWETSQTIERAMSWNVASGNTKEGWLQVKLGTQFDAGFGVTTETEIWGSINSSINVTSRTNGAEESIISTTTTQNISTSSDEDVTGDAGDLFIGAAINLLYTRAYEVKINDQCLLEAPKRFMIAQNGFGTQYVYTDAAIRQNVIPTLQSFATNPGTSDAEKSGYLNQVKVWQQILTNNEINKKRASFDKNISFFGSSGPITNSTSTTATQSSTIEFSMEIDAGLAVELGLEIAGSGISGGVNVNFRTETGKSKTTTSSKTTTIGYTLDDNDALDNFSVNVRRDPVYNTPVFQTVAGQSSCPAEDHTLARDEMYFQINNPEVSVGANEDAVFNFELGNLSVDVNSRTYNLSFDQASNPFGATISIGGIPMGFSPIPYSIDQLDVVPVTVNVKRNTANSAYTYEGLRFYLSDACTGEVYKTGTITARFQAPCSSVNLMSPAEGWLCNKAGNNRVPIQFNGYDVAGIQRIAMEFCKVGSNNWRTGFSRLANELGTGGNGTLADWDVTTISDGQYYVRLKLTCSSGIIYSQRVMGTIDRTAPLVFGVSQPSDKVFSLGDELSFTFNENLDLEDLNSGKAQLIRLSDSTSLPILVSGYENKVMVTTSTSLLSFAGEILRLIVKDISDAQGNIKTTPDTLNFTVGSFTPATGNKALEISLTPSLLTEGAAETFAFRFSLPVNTTSDVQVNFSVSGSTSFGDDYSVTYSNSNRLNSFDGTQGVAIIPRNQSSVTVKVKALADSKSENDETVVLSISEGGDYLIGANYFASATIQNVGLQPPIISGLQQFCEGGSVTLSITHPEILNPDVTFVWSNGQTGSSIVVSQGGSYTCTATNLITMLSGTSQAYELVRNPLPGTNAGADFSITQNTGNQLISGIPVNGTWSGTGVSGNSFNSSQTPGTYNLVYCVTNTFGCTRCDTLKATVLPIPTQVATPVISPGTGSYTSPQTITISSATSGSTIYYTTTGNNPVIGTGFTKVYSGPFQISSSATIRAMAVKSGLINSGITAAFLTISGNTAVANPVIFPGTGSFVGSINVTLSCATIGAQIYYTTSGNVPVIGTGFTKLYTGSFPLSATTTVRAIAVKTGSTNSGVVVATLTITGALLAQSFVSTPVITPATGLYTGPQTVSINTITSGATIYYTTNGNVPRIDVANSFTKMYTGSFVVNQTTTIRAFAVANGMINSNVVVANLSFGVAREAVIAETEKNETISPKLKIWPNPANSEIHLNSESVIENGVIEIRDLLGRLLHHEEEKQLLSKSINVRNLPTGVYILRIVNGIQKQDIRFSKL